MNFIDLNIVTVVGEFSREHLVFSRVVETVSSNNLFKGGVLIPIVWWAWFRQVGAHPQAKVRLRLTAMFLSCAVAMVVARVMARTMPFRTRPVFSESLAENFPKDIVQVALDSWSSFPSDHAALFFALATGLFFVSRPAGTVAFFYTILFIGAPRVFLGLHFLSDVLAGAAIGIAVACLGNSLFVRGGYLQRVVDWSYGHPSWFYPMFFLLSFQVSELFESARYLAKAVWGLMR